jgi:hypothetical protein
MQWANLPELHETPALDDSDLDCLQEIRDVLARHGKLARFAVHLAHRHFELAPDEILIERPDPNGRSQHVPVGRLSDEPLAGNNLAARGTPRIAPLGRRLLHLRFRPEQDGCLRSARQEPIPRRRSARTNKRYVRIASPKKRPATNGDFRLPATTSREEKGDEFRSLETPLRPQVRPSFPRSNTGSIIQSFSETPVCLGACCISPQFRTTIFHLIRAFQRVSRTEISVFGSRQRECAAMASRPVRSWLKAAHLCFSISSRSQSTL